VILIRNAKVQKNEEGWAKKKRAAKNAAHFFFVFKF
jgi:hypothetical protein